jgi:DNA-binding NtrC family response regulator
VPAESGKHALEALPGGAFDVVRDVMLPGVDGFEVCRRVRAGSLVPVILLTACGDPVGVVVDGRLDRPIRPGRRGDHADRNRDLRREQAAQWHGAEGQHREPGHDEGRTASFSGPEKHQTTKDGTAASVAPAPTGGAAAAG